MILAFILDQEFKENDHIDVLCTKGNQTFISFKLAD